MESNVKGVAEIFEKLGVELVPEEIIVLGIVRRFIAKKAENKGSNPR